MSMPLAASSCNCRVMQVPGQQFRQFHKMSFSSFAKNVFRSRTSSPSISQISLKQHSGNMIPVSEECPPTQCSNIQGELPECLDGGIYIRNGPNLKFFTPGSAYNRFDGDGLLHSVKFKNGTASYCCRFLRTSRFEQEESAGRKLFPNIFTDLKGLSGFLKLLKFILDCTLGSIDLTRGIGTASSGVFFFNGTLFATLEADKPHVIKVTEDGDLLTLGRSDFGGKLNFSMAESPRIDPATGEMFTFCYKKFLPPYLVYYRANSNGVIDSGMEINTKEPVMIHDMLITKNFAILPENQLVFRIFNMFKGELPFCLDKNRATRIAVLPKYAKDSSAVRWFQVPSLMCMHYTNAWEEGDDIVILGATIRNPENLLVDPEDIQCQLTELKVNLKTGQVRKKFLTPINGEAYQINGRCTGSECRYLFLASGSWPRFDGIYKLDLRELRKGADGVVAHRKFPEGQYTSEVTFVPEGDDVKLAEDAGYLLCYIHDELQDGNHSKLLVMDAKSPSLDVTAAVQLPRRVPHGLHGIFVSADELSLQNPLPDVLPKHGKTNIAGILEFMCGA